MSWPLRLDRQVGAAGFDQAALEKSALLLVGRRDAPMIRCLSFLAAMMGIPRIVADDSYPLAPLAEDDELALDAAPETMRLDVSLDLARAMLPGFSDTGCVTVIGDPASFPQEVGNFGRTPTWVATTDCGAIVTRDFARAKMMSTLTSGRIPSAIVHQVAATLLLDHVARARGYSDPSGMPMPELDENRGLGRWFGSQSLFGPFQQSHGPLDVHIVGQGGLASAVLRLLVETPSLRRELCAGTLTLTDFDAWQEVNANRLMTGGCVLGQPKALTNARYAEKRLAGLGVKIVADVNYFDASSLVPGDGPHVIIAATDSIESRAEVIEAAAACCPSSLCIYAGGDFDFGCARGYVHDQNAGASLCFEHGPESITNASEPDPFALGCTTAGRPANILTNVLVACAVIEIIAAWRARGVAPAQQHLVSWMNPERAFRGPEIKVGCECAEGRDLERCFDELEEVLACNR